MVSSETGIQPKSVFLVPAPSVLPCVLVGSGFTVALFTYHPSCLVCWWVLALLWPSSCRVYYLPALANYATHKMGEPVCWLKKTWFLELDRLTVWGFCWLHAHWMQALPAGSLGPSSSMEYKSEGILDPVLWGCIPSYPEIPTGYGLRRSFTLIL